MMQILIFIVLVIFFALLLGFIAQKRGANTHFWMLMGGLFGPFALPFVFFGRHRPRKQKKSNKL